MENSFTIVKEILFDPTAFKILIANICGLILDPYIITSMKQVELVVLDREADSLIHSQETENKADSLIHSQETENKAGFQQISLSISGRLLMVESELENIEQPYQVTPVRNPDLSAISKLSPEFRKLELIKSLIWVANSFSTTDDLNTSLIASELILKIKDYENKIKRTKIILDWYSKNIENEMYFEDFKNALIAYNKYCNTNRAVFGGLESFENMIEFLVNANDLNRIIDYFCDNYPYFVHGIDCPQLRNNLSTIKDAFNNLLIELQL